tara:strand:+ start:4232 stop:5395 length:1164 start_codon:yes stop_codon:yes gene_type:complete
MSLRPWRKEYLVFGSPCIGEEERQEVLACIDSLWLGSGPRVKRFEEDFAEYIENNNAVAVNSGTAALHLALKELNLEAGSEVILPSLTFCATANAAIHAGLKPVFADCNLKTMNIDIGEIKNKITDQTRVIVPVHFAGRPCDMISIMDLAKKKSLRVVEDCAHAIESTIDGKHCGTFGDYGCFSFYVTKNLTTVEGGMVVGPDINSLNRIKTMALHGMSKDAWHRFSDKGFIHYEVLEPGFKYNLSDIAASFGIHQLSRIENMYQRRQEVWEFYKGELDRLPLILPVSEPGDVRHGLHLFTCLVDDSKTSLNRDQVVQSLHELRIGCGVHYKPLHLHKYYQEIFEYNEGDLPNAEYIGQRTFSIPLSGVLKDEDAADVVKALTLIFN